MSRIDRIAGPWGIRTPYGPGEDWPTRVDSYGLAEDDVDRWVQSATILHSNGDGLDIVVKDDRIVGVRGVPGTGSTTAGSGRGTCSAAREESAGQGGGLKW